MRKVSSILGVVACSAWLLVPAWSGEIQGRIVILRSLTRKRVSIPDCQMRGVTLSTKAEKPTLAAEYKRLAVYLESVSALPTAARTANLFQKNKRFEPEIVVIPVGSTVSFPNADPIFHKVFSLSAARQFDLGYYPAGESRTVKFDRPEVVQVYRHLQPDMNAAVLVAPTPWHSQLGPAGARVPLESFAVAEVRLRMGENRRGVRKQGQRPRHPVGYFDLFTLPSDPIAFPPMSRLEGSHPRQSCQACRQRQVQKFATVLLLPPPDAM